MGRLSFKKTAAEELAKENATYDKLKSDIQAGKCSSYCINREEGYGNINGAERRRLEMMLGKYQREHSNPTAKESLSATPVSKLDLYSLLSQADSQEDQTIQFYTMLKQQKPEWAEVLDDIIREELNHRGQIQALRATIDPEVQEALSQGEVEAEQQLAEMDIEPALQRTLDEEDFERSIWDDEIAAELELEDVPDMSPIEMEEEEE